MQLTRRTYLFGFLTALVVVFAARALYYYRGFYSPPDVPEATPRHLESLAGDLEQPVVVEGSGQTILVDLAHSNGFDQDELGLFVGRLTANGAQVAFIDDQTQLVDQLRNADTLLVAAPNRAFDSADVAAVQDFVTKGGHVILVGDPTRQDDPEALNSIAAGFGVIYQDDYVYSLTHNDGNFRNVLFSEFAEDNPLTDGLDEIVFQTAMSMRTAEGVQLILGDDEVYSSLSELPGGVVVAALAADGQVLALPDLTYMTSPFNSFADNDVLVDNVVEFALAGSRTFGLSDFPYFFDGPVQIVYEDPVTLNNTFSGMIDLRTALTNNGAPAALVEELDGEAAYVYLSLYDDASEDILDLLEADGVTISDEPLSEDAPDSAGTISIEDVARLEKGGAVLLHVIKPAEPEEDGEEVAPEPYRLVLLAGSEEELLDAIQLVLSGGTRNCLITAWTAVCRVSEQTEKPTPTPDNGGVSEASILVVSDDTGITLNGSTSAAAITEKLAFIPGSDTTLHSLNVDGPLTIGDLVEYDMVFWSAGDYCCVVPSKENALLLQDYLDGGGKLLIDGVFIATDWEDSEFLSDYLGAEFAGFGAQRDMEPVAEGHPLTAGFSGVVSFNLTGDAQQPDVITPVENADVIFVRGPESAAAGEATIIAIDQGASRMVYAAFPLYLLPDDALQQFLENVVTWFSS